MPNIFHFAPNELSQDAMICWLIAWAGQDGTDGDEQLRKCARRFIGALLNHKREARVRLRGAITTKIRQQDQKIDVLARINGTHILLIEDKTGTTAHSNQLARGYEAVVRGETDFGKVDEEHVRPIFLKTGNQSIADDREIEDGGYGYKVFHREDFLGVLNSYSGSHPILVDFREYLQETEDRTNSYKEWTQDHRRCDYLAWEGFYRRIESELLRVNNGIEWLNWAYVPNPSGGFLGFWWQPPGEGENCPLYLQLEVSSWREAGGEKLCFKVHANGQDREIQTRLQQEWHERVLTAGGEHVRGPARMRRGNHMTIAEWTTEWLDFNPRSGRLDIARTVENLRRAECVLTQAVR